MYAAAKQHSNRGAAEECHARAQRLLRVGEPSRAVRLLAKACQLDPGNPAYAAALQQAQQIAVDNEAKHGADSNGPGRGADAGTSSSSAAGAAGEGAASTSSSALPRQRQGQQAQRDEQPQSRKQQRKARQQQQERAGQAVPEFQDRKRTPAGRLLRIALGGLVALAIQLAALYGLCAVVPPAAPQAEVHAATGGLRAVLGRAATLLLFLPRVLLWWPSWKVAGLWAVGCGAGCAVLRTADHVQKARGRPDLVPSHVYVAGLIVAWHPLLWWACGGRWGAVLGTLGEALPIARLLGSSVWGHVVVYPLACLALRLLLSPLLPLLAVPVGYALAPALWLLRLAVWRPRWWASLPAAGGLLWAALDGERRGRGHWLQAFLLVAVWWLSGGGWWAVAHMLAYAASLSALLLSQGRWPAGHSLAQRHFFFTPAPLFVARAAWCVLAGPASGWVLLVGGGAAGLLYLHLSRGVGPHASGTYSLGGEGSWGAGQRAGGSGADSGGAPVVHLRHTVPAGAPEAVTRVLQAGNYYEVLGLASGADEADIRRAKRTLSLATHPDKIGDAPGAAEAFNLVTEACEVLGDPASRQQYDQELQDAALSSGFNFSPEDLEASGIPPDWLDRMQEFMEAVEAGDIPQQCSACGGLHFMRRTERPVAAARTCDECGTRHAVRENEVWFESESAGFMRRTIRMYACYKGAVYDMSESAACEGTLRLIHERRFPLNKHVNFFKGFGLSSGGSARGSGGTSASKKGKPAQPAARNPPPRQQGPRGSSSKKKKGRR